jgi:DnaJ-class molecular chaperone
MCLRAGECEKQCNECAGPGVAIRVQQLAPGFVQQVQMRDDRCIARGKCWVKRCKAWYVSVALHSTIQCSLHCMCVQGLYSAAYA